MKLPKLVLACSLFFCLSLVYAQSPKAAAEAKHVNREVSHNDEDLTIWKWANFAVLAAVVAFYGMKYLKPYFVGQNEAIRVGLEEARKRRADAERRSAEVQEKLANLGLEVETFRQSVLQDRGVQIDRLHKNAELELQRVRANADHQIDSVAKHARADLRRYALTKAIDLAEERVRQRMNPDLQRKLARQFVAHLEA